MDFLKELFGDDGIKYDDFVAKVNEKGYKLVDISKGDYVGKKKYDDEINSANSKLTDLQKKYDDLNDSIKAQDGGMQKKYDDLLNNYNTMKQLKETADKEVADFKRKDIVRNAGITNDRLVNLAMFELQDSKDFEKDIQEWAKNNKNLMTGVKNMPKLGGKPDVDDNDDTKFFDSFYKAAGVDKKDIGVNNDTTKED